MSNPYSGLADHRFWRRSVSNVAAHCFDPVVATRFRVSRQARVATAGSCFAQHVSRQLAGAGFNYFVAERGEALQPAEREARQYGLFSARYGNIYTSRQLLQLAAEAIKQRQPEEAAWQATDGGYVDPYRPSVEPGGFNSIEALIADRALHLTAVRAVLEQSDVFVFTLGLTECWRSRRDGSVYPLAPGVAGGAFDPARHEFVNLGVDDVVADMDEFLALLKFMNPSVRVVLTVSPVPLIATYEDRNVAVSTAVSKAVLRVAADILQRSHDWVDYFPSYEIITGSQAGGLYFEEDRRIVNEAGVAHAMRVFLRHYAEEQAPELSAPRPFPKPTPASRDGELATSIQQDGRIVCDEETIERVSLRPPPLAETLPLSPEPARRGLAGLIKWLGGRIQP